MDKSLQQFMENMISNMQYIGEDIEPNILFLPFFYHLHHASRSEFECPCCQDAISRVLLKLASLESSMKTSPLEFEVPIIQDQ